MNNIFVKDVSYYTRHLDPIEDYKKQTVFFVSKMKDLSEDEAYKRIATLFKEKQVSFTDPEVTFHRRGDNGDKVIDTSSLTQYLKENRDNNLIQVPTLTTYLPDKTKKSLLVDFVNESKYRRSLSKKAAAKAKNEGKTLEYIDKNNEQARLKIYVNALSGTFGAKGTVFSNPSAHSTLTSITRIETSITNALNEKILSGNRHYYNYKIALNNINFLAFIAKDSNITEVMEKFNLHYPTSEEVLDVVMRSTNFYWPGDPKLKGIKNYLDKCTKEELASIAYTSDFYHIRKLNEDFVRTFFSKIIRKKRNTNHENAVEKLSNVPEAILTFAMRMFLDEVKGLGLGKDDFEKNFSLQLVSDLYEATLNIEKTLVEYKDFFQCFFRTQDMPVSIANIKDMQRRDVVLSDTDSTMYSCDEWVTWWFYGDFKFAPEGESLSAALGFIIANAVKHLLAQYSANMGVDTSKIFKMEMKPEFVFPVFVQSPVSKHYFTCISVKEGSVFPKPDYEIKGVHLKNSALPTSIMTETHKKMEYILNTILDNKKISLRKEVAELAFLEQSLKKNIIEGTEVYFKQVTVKEEEAYKDVWNKSPTFHYVLWQTVFAPKYGDSTPPPFKAFSLPLTLNNKSSTKKWLDDIEDRALAERLSKFLIDTNKVAIGTLAISTDIIREIGIPKEILLVLDVKKIILNLTLSRRIIIDSLGFTPKTDMLIKDMLPNLLQ